MEQNCSLFKEQAGFIAFHFKSAGWCSGFIYVSHAADRGSIPGCGKSASHQTVSGTASAGNAHSLARRINPSTASLVPRYGVAQGYRKGDEHLRPSKQMERPKFALHCILLYVLTFIIKFL